MKLGQKIDKINDVLFWSLIFILIGNSVWNLVHYSVYGLLFDFSWNAKGYWLRDITVAFGGIAYLSYKFGMYRGAKSKKCCLQYITEAQK